MKGFRRKLDYILKHNIMVNKIFKLSASTLFHFIGIFVPVDKKMIIFSGLSRKYNDSPRAIYEEMIANPKYNKYKMVWAIEKGDDVVIPGKPIIVTPDTLKYFIYCLKAKYWITCVNIERSLNFKKKNCRYLNTWHGCPLKTIGNAASGRNDYNFEQINYFCSSGKYEDEIYIRDFNVRKESIIHTGLPRNDELYNVSDKDINIIRKKLNIPKEKKVILYAPTWRDSVDGGKSYSIKPPIDFKKWKKELGEEYIVLLRTHPNTNELLGVEFDEFVRNYSEYEKINDLLKITDILVSDYSATIFDFSILERPIISFAYDYEEYTKERGLYLDLKKNMPGGIEKNENNVIKRIKKINWNKEKENVKKFKNKYIKFGGNATKECILKLFE